MEFAEVIRKLHIKGRVLVTRNFVVEIDATDIGCVSLSDGIRAFWMRGITGLGIRDLRRGPERLLPAVIGYWI